MYLHLYLKNYKSIYIFIIRIIIINISIIDALISLYLAVFIPLLNQHLLHY